MAKVKTLETFQNHVFTFLQRYLLRVDLLARQAALLSNAREENRAYTPIQKTNSQLNTWALKLVQDFLITTWTIQKL